MSDALISTSDNYIENWSGKKLTNPVDVITEWFKDILLETAIDDSQRIRVLDLFSCQRWYGGPRGFMQFVHEEYRNILDSSIFNNSDFSWLNNWAKRIFFYMKGREEKVIPPTTFFELSKELWEDIKQLQDFLNKNTWYSLIRIQWMWYRYAEKNNNDQFEIENRGKVKESIAVQLRRKRDIERGARIEAFLWDLWVWPWETGTSTTLAQTPFDTRSFTNNVDELELDKNQTSVLNFLRINNHEYTVVEIAEYLWISIDLIQEALSQLIKTQWDGTAYGGKIHGKWEKVLKFRFIWNSEQWVWDNEGEKGVPRNSSGSGLGGEPEEWTTNADREEEAWAHTNSDDDSTAVENDDNVVFGWEDYSKISEENDDLEIDFEAQEVLWVKLSDLEWDLYFILLEKRWCNIMKSVVEEKLVIGHDSFGDVSILCQSINEKLWEDNSPAHIEHGGDTFMILARETDIVTLEEGEKEDDIFFDHSWEFKEWTATRNIYEFLFREENRWVGFIANKIQGVGWSTTFASQSVKAINNKLNRIWSNQRIEKWKDKLYRLLLINSWEGSAIQAWGDASKGKNAPTQANATWTSLHQGGSGTAISDSDWRDSDLAPGVARSIWVDKWDSEIRLQISWDLKTNVMNPTLFDFDKLTVDWIELTHNEFALCVIGNQDGEPFQYDDIEDECFEWSEVLSKRDIRVLRESINKKLSTWWSECELQIVSEAYILKVPEGYSLDDGTDDGNSWGESTTNTPGEPSEAASNEETWVRNDPEWSYNEIRGFSYSEFSEIAARYDDIVCDLAGYSVNGKELTMDEFSFYLAILEKRWESVSVSVIYKKLLWEELRSGSEDQVWDYFMTIFRNINEKMWRAQSISHISRNAETQSFSIGAISWSDDTSRGITTQATWGENIAGAHAIFEQNQKDNIVRRNLELELDFKSHSVLNTKFPEVYFNFYMICLEKRGQLLSIWYICERLWIEENEGSYDEYLKYAGEINGNVDKEGFFIANAPEEKAFIIENIKDPEEEEWAEKKQINSPFEAGSNLDKVFCFLAQNPDIEYTKKRIASETGLSDPQQELQNLIKMLEWVYQWEHWFLEEVREWVYLYTSAEAG